MRRVPLYIQAAGVLSLAPVFLYVKGRHFNARGGVAGRIKWRTVKHFHRLRLAMHRHPPPAAAAAAASSDDEESRPGKAAAAAGPTSPESSWC